MTKVVKAKSTKRRFVVEVVVESPRPVFKKQVREALQRVIGDTVFGVKTSKAYVGLRARVRKVDLD